eukprot:gene7521-1989_t
MGGCCAVLLRPAARAGESQQEQRRKALVLPFAAAIGPLLLLGLGQRVWTCAAGSLPPAEERLCVLSPP